MLEQIVLVILEDASDRIALQLRDDLPEVAYRDHWGLFGGHVEPGEMPALAISRELQEELGVLIEARHLKQLETFRIAQREYYVFLFSLANELASTQLTEGQHFALFSRPAIEKSEINGKQIVTHHLEVIKRYWRARGELT